MAVSAGSWPSFGVVILLRALRPPLPPPPLPSIGSPAGTAWLPSWHSPSPSPGFLLPAVSCPAALLTEHSSPAFIQGHNCPSRDHGLPGLVSLRSAHLGERVEGWAGWTPRLSRTPPLGPPFRGPRRHPRRFVGGSGAPGRGVWLFLCPLCASGWCPVAPACLRSPFLDRDEGDASLRHLAGVEDPRGAGWTLTTNGEPARLGRLGSG